MGLDSSNITIHPPWNKITVSNCIVWIAWTRSVAPSPMEADSTTTNFWLLAKDRRTLKDSTAVSWVAPIKTSPKNIKMPLKTYHRNWRRKWMMFLRASDRVAKMRTMARDSSKAFKIVEVVLELFHRSLRILSLRTTSCTSNATTVWTEMGVTSRPTQLSMRSNSH